MRLTRAKTHWVLGGILLSAVAAPACGTAPERSEGVAERDPLIELRLVREEVAPGLQTVEFGGETLYLESAPVLSDDDFESVAPLIRPDQLHLELQLTREATERVISVTSAEIGSRMAIVVDSEVRSTPVIRDAVGGPRSSMIIPAPEEEARRLAALVRDRWPEDP